MSVIIDQVTKIIIIIYLLKKTSIGCLHINCINIMHIKLVFITLDNISVVDTKILINKTL